MPKPIKGGCEGKGKRGKGYKRRLTEMLGTLDCTTTTITTTVYFLQFACDLCIVANVSPKVLETSEEPGFKKPKKASKQNIEIS